MNQTIGQAIETVFDKAPLKNLLLLSRIQANWAVIIGDSLVKVTKPLKIKNKCLYVGVSDAAYAQHLLYFQNHLLVLLASPYICDEGTITKITFQVIPFTNEKTIQTKQKKTKPKLTVQTNEKIEKTGQLIQNAQVKRSFQLFMQTTLQKQADFNR